MNIALRYAPPAVQVATESRRERSRHYDARKWIDVRLTADDIVVASYAKSGTVWLQQIIALALTGGEFGYSLSQSSPWVESHEFSAELLEGCRTIHPKRRLLKTHLPFDLLPYNPSAKYVFIGRDGRDICLSIHNHHLNAKQAWYKRLNSREVRDYPVIEQPTEDFNEYFIDWMKRDGYPFWPYWECVSSWWGARTLPNVMLLHYTDLLNDRVATIRRVLEFVGIQSSLELEKRIAKKSEFSFMKDHASLLAPFGGAFWNNDGRSLFRYGSNGNWQGLLSPEFSAKYEECSNAELGEECSSWMKRI